MADDDQGAPRDLTVSDAAGRLSGLLSAGDVPEKKPAGATDATPQDSPQSGDAAPGETPPSGDDQAKEPQGDPAPIDPPVSWDAEAKERFAKLPRDDQEYLAQRESERDREVRRLQNESADVRKAAEADRDKAFQQLSPFQQQLSQLADAMLQEVMGEFADIKSPADAARLSQEDPARYVRFDGKMKLLQAANAASAQLQHQQNQRNAEERAKILREEFGKLKDTAPLLVDEKTAPAERAAVVKYLTDQQFLPENIDNIIDHRHLTMVWKSMKYDQAQAAAAKAKVTNLPRVIKPGSGSNASEGDAEVTASLKQLARKTGTVKDAGKALSRFAFN